MARLSSTQSHALGTTNARRQEAMSGDMVFTASPATAGTTAAAATTGSDRTVTVSVTNAAGDVHEWYNATVATSVTIAETTAGDGTASVDTTTATYVNGVATFVVTTAATWAEDDTSTLAIATKDIMGYTLAAVAAASVDTIIA